MKKFVIATTLVALLLAINISAFAANTIHQYGNVCYRIPAGYKEERTNSCLLLVPRGQTFDHADMAFAITPGVAQAPQNLQLLLKLVIDNLEAGRQIIKREIYPITREDGTKIYMELSVSKNSFHTFCSLYVVANAGGRGELLAVSSSDPREFLRREQQIKEFFSGIGFANLNNSNYTVARNQRPNGYNSRQSRQNNNYVYRQNQRAYFNQTILNSIGNNYNNLSRSFVKPY
jgi:hypothetical protein